MLLFLLSQTLVLGVCCLVLTELCFLTKILQISNVDNRCVSYKYSVLKLMCWFQALKHVSFQNV